MFRCSSNTSFLNGVSQVRILSGHGLSCLGTSLTAVSGHACTFTPAAGSPAGVQSELPKELTVLSEDTHLKVGHQQEHPRPRKPPSEPDVVEPAVVPEGDPADGVDLVCRTR